MITKASSSWLLATAVLAVATILAGEPVLARGGAANIMNSPGYQRRLQESRQQLAEPRVPPSPAHRKKPRHH
ncbi:MAG TPA: hypothetical protein VMM15_34670 [Bradyrhizobium sp.]|nr:hypothetical protein [Bradyrhizobium sp.]